MASFANLSANLKLNIQDFSSKLKTASNDMNRFARNLEGRTVGAMKELNKQTNAWGLNMKSISRVVSGIVISQAFYRILQSVQAATGAVWEFTKQLEYAQIAYSNLFNSTSLANEFINVLKDFAAKSPFSFTEAESAAKRLLAYGIEYKNVMYVMQGVMSAAAIQGDPAKIEAISRAFGQIYTYGKLMTQEVRQLSEAGIPAYEILREELGLTQEQLKDLGNQGIPASEAINALVDGIQKRFGNVTEAASKTITGIISNIKDNATMLFAGIFEPAVVVIKSALAALGEFLFTLRELYELKGIGGVFERVFPPELHDTLRQFVATLGTLMMAVMRLVYALGGLLRPVAEALIRVFNAFAPILTTMINVLAAVIQLITSNATAMKILTAMLAAAAAMWVLFKVKALACAAVTAVIGAISKALAGLSAVLTFVMAHPFWALLIGLGGILIGISGGFGAISDKINGFFKSLTKFNGVDPDKVLLPSQKERANDLDKFNKKLDGTSDAMDDLADSTGKATKAAKGLLSFDEVFKLNEPDEGTGNGIQVPEIDLGDIGDLGDLGGGFMPEIPDFSDFMDKLKNGFLDKLKAAWASIKEKAAGIISTALGAAFGALLGYLLKGKVGGILGAIAGAIVGYFWNKLADYFGLSPDQKIKAGVIGGVGAIIGAILGGLIGGPLGAKIGAIVGGLVGSFWGIFAEAMGITPTQHLATIIGGFTGALTGLIPGLIGAVKSMMTNLVPTYIDDVFVGFSRMAGFSIKGALMGALKQGVVGAIVGLGTGILANALTGWLAKELSLTEQDLKNSGVGQIIGNIIGSIVGLILGGPMGSLVGGALGQLAGAIVGEFWSYMNATLKGTVIGAAAGLPIGAIVGALVGSIGGPLGAALGAAIGAALGAVVGLIVDYWEPIKSFFAGVGESIAQAVTGVVNNFKDIGEVISGLLNGDISLLELAFEGLSGILDLLSIDLGDFGLAFSTVFGDMLLAVTTVMGDIRTAISTVWGDIKLAVVTVVTDIWTAITTIWGDIKLAVVTVMTDIWTAVSTVWNDISLAVSTVCSAVWGVISSIWALIRDLIIKVVTDAWNAIVQWFTPIATEISTVCTNAWNAVKQWFTNIYNTVKTYVTNAYNVVKQYFTNVYNTVKTYVTNAYNVVKQYFTNIYNTVKTYVTNVYNSVKQHFTNAYNTMKSSISDMYSAVKNGIANIYNEFKNWITNMWSNVFGKFFQWIDDGIKKLREFFDLSADTSKVKPPSTSGGGTGTTPGHATGGIFNREHIARFAEGNKAEAIIPLEENSAMQPFVDAVSNGLVASLAPLLANANYSAQQQSQLQPLYVGTLIADDRSLKELERRMEVIRVKENKR